MNLTNPDGGNEPRAAASSSKLCLLLRSTACLAAAFVVSPAFFSGLTCEAQTQTIQIDRLTPVPDATSPSGESLVVLNWTGGTSPFQVQCRAGLDGAWQDVGGVTSSHSQTNILMGPSSFYRVVSVADILASSTDKIAPSTPTGLAARAVNSSTVELNWNASTDAGQAATGVKGYNLYRNGIFLRQVAAPATSVSDTGLAPATTHSYAVSAIDNVYNQSPLSTFVSVATQPTGGCTFTISPSSVLAPAVGLSSNVIVSAAAGCSWSASSSVPWITLSGGSGGAGNGVISYFVATNTTSESRTGTLAVAGQTFTVSQFVDTTPPDVSLISPSSGSIVSGILTITASAADVVGIGKVEVYRDATLVGSATAVPYSVTDDTTEISEGSHTYSAKAYDAAGNSAVSSGNSVTVSNIVAPPGRSCIWSRHFGGSVVSVDSADPVSIKEDHNGNVVVVGRFDGTVNFGSGALVSAGSDDIFVLRYDSAGTFQWVRQFGGSSTDKATAVAIDSNNNIIVVGLFNGTVDLGGASFTSAGSSDIFVAKYSPNGALLWAKQFGGTAAEGCNALALDGADNILLTGYYGYFGTAVDFGGGPLPLPGGSSAMAKDVFVAKLSPSGGYLWAKGYAGSGYNSGNGIAVDGNGDVVVVGSFQASLNLGGNTLASAGGYDAFVAKYAGATGAHLWSVSGGGSGNDQGKGIAVDASGNVFATGEFIGTATIAGNTLSSPYTSAYPAIYLAKYSAVGAAAWAEAFVPMDSFSMAGGRGVAVDGAGNIVLTGYSQGTVDFGGGHYLSNGSTAVMLAKVSGSGGVLWVKGYAGSSLSNYAEGVSIGAGNNILVTGYFGDPIDFGCGAMTSACRADGFAAKVSP